MTINELVGKRVYHTGVYLPCNSNDTIINLINSPAITKKIIISDGIPMLELSGTNKRIICAVPKEYNDNSWFECGE